MIYKRSTRVNHRLKTLGIYTLSLLGFCWSVFPVYWMIKSSLTPNTEMYTLNPRLAPQSVTLDHYRELFTATSFSRYFMNSVYVAVLSTVAALGLSILASYSMTRLRYRGRAFIKRSVLTCCPGRCSLSPCTL